MRKEILGGILMFLAFNFVAGAVIISDVWEAAQAESDNLFARMLMLNLFVGGFAIGVGGWILIEKGSKNK